MGKLPHRLSVRRPSRDEEGFTLVEVTVSLVLVAIVTTSALSLFIRAQRSADLQAQRQQAISIANDQLERVRSLPVNDLVDGRTLASVQELWNWDPSLVNTVSVLTYDPLAVLGSVPLIKPVDPLPKADYDNVAYTVRTYIDVCYQAPTGVSCGPVQVSLSKPMLRVTVSVAWSPDNQRACDASEVKTILTGPKAGVRCQEYVVSTLRDKSPDATFNTN